MIDHDKLKQACDLFSEYFTIWPHARMGINAGKTIPGATFDLISEQINASFETIDELIEMLQELLAQPRPIDGWVIDGLGKIDYWTNIPIDHNHQVNGMTVYSSREALIEAQIEHWQKMHCEDGRHKMHWCEIEEGIKTCDYCGITSHELSIKKQDSSTRSDDMSMTPAFEGEVKGFDAQEPCYEMARMEEYQDHQENELEKVCDHEKSGAVSRHVKFAGELHYHCKKCGEFDR